MRVLQTGTFHSPTFYLHQYWDWPAAEREIKRGLELNSNSPDAHAAYATYLAVMGRLNEAVTEQEQALRLNPLDAASEIGLGNVLRNVGRDQEAIASYQKAIELDPNQSDAHAMLAEVYEKKGMYAESVSELKLSLKLDPHPRYGDADFLTRAYRERGFSAAKKALWQRQLERGKEGITAKTSKRSSFAVRTAW